MQPYHKYVFDSENRQFVGKFEEMYQGEDSEQYDSWFQEDLTSLAKQLSLTVLERHNFGQILDVGCGKGAFTHLLKKANNQVTGLDISLTAVRKARAKYPHIRFEVMEAPQMALLNQAFDLVVVQEVLSYLDGWRDVLQTIALMTQYIYTTLYLPPNPIGYVKSFDDLRDEISKHFTIETEVLVNQEILAVFAKTRSLGYGREPPILSGPGEMED